MCTNGTEGQTSDPGAEGSQRLAEAHCPLLGAPPAEALGILSHVSWIQAMRTLGLAGRRCLFIGALNMKSAVIEKIEGGGGGCIYLFIFCNEWLQRATLFIIFLSALAVKGELATNLLSMLPCCSTGYQNWQFLGPENPSLSSGVR